MTDALGLLSERWTIHYKGSNVTAGYYTVGELESRWTIYCDSVDWACWSNWSR